MKRSIWTKTAILFTAACGAVSLPGIGPFAWQTSAEEVTQTEQGTETISGKVSKLVRNDHEDVDGLTLENGRAVHFPPHIGREVEQAIKPGDMVIVVGRNETRPKGEKVFAAVRLEAKGKTIKVTRPAPPPGKDGPQEKPRAVEATKEVSGKVVELVKNGKGDIDGLLLADKTEVRFPPHQGKDLAKLVAIGDQVKVTGHTHETPKGEHHFHAKMITAVKSGESIERDEPAPHRPPAPPHGPKGKHEPKAGPKHEPKAGPKHEPHAQPPHEEILREIRELRKLIERKFPDKE
ncbi:OB-fold nucleic acid binding domain-containing protein [Anatilimnocola sp. NA78]|uniref:OB-fold nucleic acid binding domain-containing protein n=1 Tax=Anatilimnocola sp. NA78 TaxID=3415683 RepID=UPI003CE4A4BF